MTVTIEEVKKFWNDRPCNIKHSSKELGTKEYFNEVERKNGGFEKFVIDNEKTYKSAPSKELNNDSLVGRHIDAPPPALAPNNPEGPVNV